MIKEYIIVDLIPILLSGLISFCAAYIIMKNTLKGEKDLQKQIKEEQRCEDIYSLFCEFKAEASEAFFSANKTENLRQTMLGIISLDEREEVLKNYEMEFKEHIYRIKILKDKIMLKARGIEEFESLEPEFNHITELYPFLQCGQDIYHHELDLLSQKVQLAIENHLKHF